MRESGQMVSGGPHGLRRERFGANAKRVSVKNKGPLGPFSIIVFIANSNGYKTTAMPFYQKPLHSPIGGFPDGC